MTKAELKTKLMAYECGALEEYEVEDLFQELVNSGLAWQLGKHIGDEIAIMLQLGKLRRAA